jgi:hypothetical protein
MDVKKMVPKDLAQRLKELEVCLKSIALSLHEIKKHKSLDIRVHIHNLQPQLRQLIALGNRNFSPRLIGIADELGIPLEFYAVPEPGQGLAVRMKVIDDDEEVFFSPILYLPSWCFQKTWSPFPKPNFQKRKFSDWMEEIVYKDEANQYTRNRLLRAIADKDGGGHLDDDQDRFVFSLQQNLSYTDHDNTQWNLTGKDLFLIDLAIFVSWMGRRILLCSELGISEHPAISQIDSEFDKFEIVHIRELKNLVFVVPRLDSWGYKKLPKGQTRVGLRFWRIHEWWNAPDTYPES